MFTVSYSVTLLRKAASKGLSDQSSSKPVYSLAMFVELRLFIWEHKTIKITVLRIHIHN